MVKLAARAVAADDARGGPETLVQRRHARVRAEIEIAVSYVADAIAGGSERA